MRLTAIAILLALAVFAGIASLKSVNLNVNPAPTLSIPVITTPTTVAVSGPAILDAIHDQARLETVSMTFALDQDLNKTWGVEGVCQESITYLGYYNVTAGVDLQQIGAGDVAVETAATLAQTAITIRLPPAIITHVELDTKRSRVVHNQVSILSQLCGTHLAEMVLETQSNLQQLAVKAALEKNITQLAQDKAGFGLQKLLMTLGFSQVTVSAR